MRKYEMMVIVDPEVDERTVEPSMSALFGQVEDLGAKLRNLMCGASASSPTPS